MTKEQEQALHDLGIRQRNTDLLKSKIADHLKKMLKDATDERNAYAMKFVQGTNPDHAERAKCLDMKVATIKHFVDIIKEA
jgi:hypothetical protein